MSCFFFFNDTATTEIYTLSLHDALPISWRTRCGASARSPERRADPLGDLRRLVVARVLRARPEEALEPVLRVARDDVDRKSTRLNSSHANISYAVFCLKKKNTPIRLSHI